MVDLSTGINPHGWPVPELPAGVWQRLPESSPALLDVAERYYGTRSLLPVAGSQAAIMALPRLRPRGDVGILAPSYSEHRAGWEMAGHEVVALDSDAIEESLPALDVLVVVNPNNPTGERFSLERLLRWHQQLADRGGWLVVDEAFIDATPEQSLCALVEPKTGLVVLRSLGKFFGLAGIRSGFVFAMPQLLDRLERLLGPWSLSHPAQWVTEQALRDRSWQQQMCAQLPDESDRLFRLLEAVGLRPVGSTSLFQWVATPQAAETAHQLARQGVLIRLFDRPSSLRFGLPSSEGEWARLQDALVTINTLHDKVNGREAPREDPLGGKVNGREVPREDPCPETTATQRVVGCAA